MKKAIPPITKKVSTDEVDIMAALALIEAHYHAYTDLEGNRNRKGSRPHPGLLAIEAYRRISPKGEDIVLTSNDESRGFKTVYQKVAYHQPLVRDGSKMLEIPKEMDRSTSAVLHDKRYQAGFRWLANKLMQHSRHHRLFAVASTGKTGDPVTLLTLNPDTKLQSGVTARDFKVDTYFKRAETQLDAAVKAKVNGETLENVNRAIVERVVKALPAALPEPRPMKVLDESAAAKQLD